LELSPDPEAVRFIRANDADEALASLLFLEDL
jgi:hypothetical protein